MIKISDSLAEIISKNSFLKFALARKLLNLSNLALYLQPQIETRSKKPVTKAAITMALSRYQKSLSTSLPSPPKIQIEAINVYANLSTLTYYKSAQLHQQLLQLYQHLRKKNGFISINESSSEITIIIDKHHLKAAQHYITEKPKHKRQKLSSISVKFIKDQLSGPGLIATILQQVATQGVSVVELSSTHTEIMLFVDQDDAKITFDTLFNCFCA